MGLVQSVAVAPSKLQVNRTPASASEKLKLLFAEALGFAGRESIVGTGGGGASTTHVKLAAKVALPSARCPETPHVFDPPTPLEEEKPLVQACLAAPRNPTKDVNAR